MKIQKEFELREIAGEYIIVPIGPTTLNFNGLITVNEVGMMLWKMLQDECTEEELVAKVLEEYEVDEITAKNDVKEFLEQLRNENIIS